MFDQITKAANDATDTVTDAIKGIELGEQFTTTSDQVLDTVLDVNRRVVDFAVTTADRVADQINVELPFADSLPTPTVAGERYLDFVERAVSLNRDVNQRIVEMIAVDNAETVVRTVSDAATSATKAATKAAPAKRTAAKKTTAKKATAKKATAKKAATSN